MKVYGNVRLASVSGKGKTYSALKIKTDKKITNSEYKIIPVNKEPER